MNKENKLIPDCGFSKIRAGAFNRKNKDKNFYAESEFLKTRLNIRNKDSKNSINILRKIQMNILTI